MDQTWRKSSYSANEPTCVETRLVAATVGVRDTKDRVRATVAFTPGVWQTFVDHVK